MGENMFLIEFSEGEYIDGTSINWIKLNENKIMFSTQFEATIYTVSGPIMYSFLNSLDALNDNATKNLSADFNKLNVATGKGE